MDSDLAVHESVFHGPSGDPEDPDLFCEDRVLRLRRRYAPTKRAKRADDFIVDDWDESAMQQAIIPRCKSKVDLRPAGSDLQWSLDFSNIYAIAIGQQEIPPKRSKTTKMPTPKPRTFDELLVDLQDRIYKPPTKKAYTKTIVELSDKVLSTEQLDQSAQDLKQLFSTIIPEVPDPDAAHRYLMLSLPSRSTVYGMPSRLSEDADRHMFDSYDGMVDDWVSKLHHQIPIPARLAKEKLIRKVAADLLLSRVIKITSSLDPVISPPVDPIATQNEQVVAQNRNIPSSFFQSQFPASQPAMAHQLESQRTLTPAPSKYSTVPILSGLSAFTTFKKPRPTPSNVSHVLSQWTVGDDPSRYIWERIEDEETRASQAPRTPRRQKRPKREQSLPATPLVPMVRTWGSQPVPPISIPSSQAGPMTQTERGIFGTRDKKKKKKKRAAGF